MVKELEADTALNPAACLSCALSPSLAPSGLLVREAEQGPSVWDLALSELGGGEIPLD